MQIIILKIINDSGSSLIKIVWFFTHQVFFEYALKLCFGLTQNVTNCEVTHVIRLQWKRVRRAGFYRLFHVSCIFFCTWSFVSITFYVITSKLDILVGHSGEILAKVLSTIIKVLNLTVIVCHLGVCPKMKQLIIVTWLIYQI